ncbi:DUF2946 family protein [Methylocystis echinoides]|nr:hypothetical protein [Methylocystis echinoides]
MRFRGHLIDIILRNRALAGRAPRARLLAMALLILAQGLALTLGSGVGGLSHGEFCERPSAQLAAGVQSPAPTTDIRHDCAACLACAFGAVIDAATPASFRPQVYPAKVAEAFEAAPALTRRWRAAHTARAPPVFS